jgi:hypothetical protein
MDGVGFNNNGLTGITAINLVSEAGSFFTNLAFFGSVHAMNAFYCDRCAFVKVQNIEANGTTGSYFGSTIDGTNGYSQSVRIEHYFYVGAAASVAALTLERCNCEVRDFGALDYTVSVTGTALVVANDSQGVLLDDIRAEGMLVGVYLERNTVGMTLASPSFLTMSNVQLDCAGGPCGTTAFAYIKIDTLTNIVNILNPTLTATTTAGYGIVIATNCSGIRVANGFLDITSGINVNVTAPSDGFLFENNTVLSTSPGVGLNFPGAGNITNSIITGNYMTGTAVSSSSTFVSALINNNMCPGDTNEYCIGGLTGNRTPKDWNYVSSETGVNNAIAGALLDPRGQSMLLSLGLKLCINLSHTLQAGANTLTLNGTSKNIKSHFNASNNIATAYASGAQWCGIYDGFEWLDTSQ